MDVLQEEALVEGGEVLNPDTAIVAGTVSQFPCHLTVPATAFGLALPEEPLAQ